MTDVCREALEDACVVAWISVDLTTVTGAKQAIAKLCEFEVQLATDPATNGGLTLQPAPAAVAVPDEISQEQAAIKMPYTYSSPECYQAGWNDCRRAMLAAAPAQEKDDEFNEDQSKCGACCRYPVTSINGVWVCLRHSTGGGK